MHCRRLGDSHILNFPAVNPGHAWRLFKNVLMVKIKKMTVLLPFGIHVQLDNGIHTPSSTLALFFIVQVGF